MYYEIHLNSYDNVVDIVITQEFCPQFAKTVCVFLGFSHKKKDLLRGFVLPCRLVLKYAGD